MNLLDFSGIGGAIAFDHRFDVLNEMFMSLLSS